MPSITTVHESLPYRIAASPDPTKPTPLRAIDLSRYEAPDIADPSTAGREELEPALAQAYTAMSYLSARRQNLALLDSYGKNAWLVGNWHLEAELRSLEREVADARREIDLVTIRRQRVQEEVGGEIRGLDETWRRGVGRVLETEVAAEGVRREVLEVQRELAQRAQAEV
ncbi:Pre-mRNA-splicing factor SPF27 [Cytospora mali]|uniref:Pre-mRNA-splicing factor SPF27 n=1 Tax=Cytospora mali TaxID=578113 RepID=A0A194UUN7_CYTMA|nr:Pre-mRNA-splicing factor SPF27 [Valsa mali var. pyri (nom. inval.)]